MSNRYAEVIALRAQGLTHRQIADRLGISPASSRTYVKRDNRLNGISAPNRVYASTLRGHRTVAFAEDGRNITVTWENRNGRADVIVRMLRAGYTQKAVAWTLGIAPRTIEATLRQYDLRAVDIQNERRSRSIEIKVFRTTRDRIEAYAIQNHLRLNTAADVIVEAGLKALMEGADNA